MSSRSVYEALVAVSAAGLDQRPSLQDTCCVIKLKHEEVGSDLLLQELCSGWRPGLSPVYSDTAKPFRLFVGDGDLAAVSDASLMVTLYGRVQRQKPGTLFSCLGQPATAAVEVLLQQELPLQQVLMAASMSRVHQLQLPGGGSLRCEVALSHPQHGSPLLVAIPSGSGLQVLDQEERVLLQVQAVRVIPQRTAPKAKRRYSERTGTSSWVATDAATGQIMPAASPSYELQVIAGSEAGSGSRSDGGQQQAPSSDSQLQPAARCRMDPAAERFTIMLRDEGAGGSGAGEGYTSWATLVVKQLPGPADSAALQLSVPSLPQLQLTSSCIVPTASSILSSSAPAIAPAAAAAAAGGGVNRVHPNSSKHAAAGGGQWSSSGGCAAHHTLPLGVRYVLQQPAGARRSLDAAASRPAGAGSSMPRRPSDTPADELLACIAVAARKADAGVHGRQGAAEEQHPAEVFAIELQLAAGKHAAAIVCLAALLAELM